VTHPLIARVDSMALALAQLRRQAQEGVLGLTRADLPAVGQAPRGRPEAIAARLALLQMIEPLQDLADEAVRCACAGRSCRHLWSLQRGRARLASLGEDPAFAAAASGAATAWRVSLEHLLAELVPAPGAVLPEQDFFAPLV